MNHARFSRRNLIAATVGAAAASRLTPWMPITARAAEAAAPKRLLVVFTPMGFLESTFWPKMAGDDIVQSPTMAALDPYKKKLTYLDGLGMWGGSGDFPDDDNEHGSGMCCAFTGGKVQNALSNSPSIDQVVANTLAAAKVGTRFKSLALGVNSGAGGKHRSCFFSASQQPVTPQTSPQQAFDYIFKDVKIGPSEPVDTTAFDRIKKQKQKVLDAVRGDLDKVCKRIGSAEKEKCGAHAAGIEALIANLDKLGPITVGQGCYKPAVVGTSDLVATVHAQMDIAAAALSCDLTRVATLQLGHADGGLSMIPGIDHHNTTHAVGGDAAGQAVEDHKKIDAWMAARIAYLLGRLDSVSEGSGTMLDNTLVLFGSDTTTAINLKQGPHRHFRFPYFLAGGANLGLKTGRVISYTNPNSTDVRKWTPHTRLLVSIARMFGANVDTFGGWDTGSGPLAQLL